MKHKFITSGAVLLALLTSQGVYASETTESPILDELRQLDIYNMTPMEVMLAVAEMKKHL